MSMIEFEFTETDRFRRLATAFAALQLAKQTGNLVVSDDWQQYFDAEALATFWWPSEPELRAFEEQWLATPVERRWSDPSLKRPWMFDSMIDGIANAEYKLVACRQLSDTAGRIEYQPYAHPFGGTESLRALIEAFGCRVVREAE